MYFKSLIDYIYLYKKLCTIMTFDPMVSMVFVFEKEIKTIDDSVVYKSKGNARVQRCREKWDEMGRIEEAIKCKCTSILRYVT